MPFIWPTSFYPGIANKPSSVKVFFLGKTSWSDNETEELDWIGIIRHSDMRDREYVSMRTGQYVQ